MPEEEKKEKRKKPAVLLKILKWFSLGVPIFLLIVGLFFQAPLKFNVLLLIFILACTALPKKALEWFWLSVGVVVIALVVWVFLPQETDGWRPYTFDEQRAALEAKYAVPDEENAALIYNKLLESYDGYIFVCPDFGDRNAEEIKNLTLEEYDQLEDQARPKDTFYPDFWDDEIDDITKSGPWSSRDYPKIAEWLKEKQSIIESLLEACRLKACKFTDCMEAPNSEQMTRNSAIRRWAKLLICAANNDRAEGRLDQALEKHMAVLQMGEHLSQQPMMTDMLVGTAIKNLGLWRFNNFIVTGNVTEKHLKVTGEAIEKVQDNWSSYLPAMLDFEKQKLKNMFCSMMYEVNAEGKVRLSRDQTQETRRQFLLPSPTYWQRKLAKAATIVGWFFMPSDPKEIEEFIDTAYERFYAMTKNDFDWQKEPRRLGLRSIKLNYRGIVDMLTYVLEPVYYEARYIYMRAMANKKSSLIIIALRRLFNQTGQWAESLDQITDLVEADTLIDPMNGGPFIYKPTEENFTLYSSGKNGIDEDGRYVSKRDPNDFSKETIEADDFLIWPPKSKKSEKEKTDG